MKFDKEIINQIGLHEQNFIPRADIGKPNRGFYSGTMTTAASQTEPALTYDTLVQFTRKFAPLPKIQVTDYLPTETVQARRHKRKSSRRWQKKWLKRFGTKEVRSNKIYQIGDTILIDRETERKVKEKISENMRDYERKQAASFFGIDF
jgi:hypothetical protein